MLRNFGLTQKKDIRADLQALRGLSVLFVVLYHSDLLFFRGGYIGVDIFFVISGYLIIKKIIIQLLNDNFSLKIFYLKRVSRILPVLYFVLFISALFSFLIKHPLDNIFFAKSSISTLLFYPNIFYWQNINYFNPKTEFMHLIHTWSLGVEEQFYLFLPLFLIALYKMFKNKINKYLVILTLFSLISFLLYSIGYYLQLNATFYLLPFRAWEFLLGGIVGILDIKGYHLSNKKLSFLSLGGLFVCANFFNPLNYQTNYILFIPVLLSSLVILNKSNDQYIYSKLKYLVIVGNFSYSFYLLHQPIFVFARTYDIFEKYKPVWIIVSLILSYFTYIYIENKFRDYKKIKSTSLLLAVLFLLTIIINLFSISNQGFNSSVAEKYQINILERKTYIGTQIHGNEENIKFILYGDSHADHYIEYLLQEANKSNIGFISIINSACISLNNFVTFNGYIDRDCDKAFTNLQEIQKTYGVDVIISQRWDQQVIDKRDMRIYESHSKDKSNLIIEEITLFSNLISPRRVIVIGSVPGSNLPKYGGYLKCKIYLENKCPKYFQSNQGIGYELNTIFKENLSKKDIKFINPYEKICNISLCFNEQNNQILYYDNSHLSFFGSRLVVSEFIKSYIDH